MNRLCHNTPMSETLIATTTMGFESVLKQELQGLDLNDLKVFDGKVEFKGDIQDICKTNLWLRTAGRIYIKISEFKAFTFDELFEQTKALPWEKWIQQDAQFPVTQVTSRKSVLFSKSDCQAIVKKAVVNRLQSVYKASRLPETGPVVPIRIQIEKDQVILSIDTSGSGLNKRGYRDNQEKAPLRETLAAGLILLSRWRPNEDVLIDPFCGSGTILIEAGLMAKNIAPGLNRTFGAENWSAIPKSYWDEARKEEIGRAHV